MYYIFHIVLYYVLYGVLNIYGIINPRRACAVKVTVVVLYVCVSVCLSVHTRYSGSTCY